MYNRIPSMDVDRTPDAATKQLLEFSDCILNRHIDNDAARSSFLENTSVAQERAPTCSGLNAGDYRNLTELLNHPNLSQYQIANNVPLPQEIMKNFTHMQCHCLMGVFPELSRVWITIDSNIYIWAFEHGSDVTFFDGLGETIVSVGLVKPKPKVFQSFVKYLLVLTTTVEIVVLGVTWSNTNESSSEKINLVPEPVFVLPTDGVAIMSVNSTDSGRIFVGGRDGCLYEIIYQAQMGWLGKHYKKVNLSAHTLSFVVPSFINAALYDEDPILKIEVDNSRNILYTLSEKGCIEAFDLGHNGELTRKFVKLEQHKIVNEAVEIVKTLEAHNFKPIVSISPLDVAESQHLNLVAVTQVGARLYFSTGCGNSGIQQGGTLRPQYLTLIHVRLPPGFASSSSLLKPKQVHQAVYECGTLAMVCSGSDRDEETLWLLSPVMPGGGFSEAHSLLALDAPAWALTALPPHRQSQLSSALLDHKEVWRVSRWAVVTGAGACVLSVGAAPHLLSTLLRDCRGPDAQPVRDFFQLYNTEQACACALYLICEHSGSLDLIIREWATRAFYLYGSPAISPEITYHNPATQMDNTSAGSTKFLPTQTSTPMLTRGQQGQMQQGRLNQSYQPPLNQSSPGSPNLIGHSISSTPLNQSPFHATQQRYPNFSGQQVEYSARHNALYIYIGRILAPIWNLKCVEKKTSDKKEFLVSQITNEDCLYLLQRLQRANVFVQRMLAPLQTDEYYSLEALKHFITMAMEILDLWKILSEHQFHVVAASLPYEQQCALTAASFKDLMIGGQQMACSLIDSLVAGYLTDNASVDSISKKLRLLCPTLFRPEDATCSKVNELLIFAKQQNNPAARDEILQHALKLCVDVAPNVNLSLVCLKLISLGFYSGVVELCCACASRSDPQNKALHYYESDQPSQDKEGHLAYHQRMNIYREVCIALERLYKGNGESSSDIPATMPQDNYQGRQLVWLCLLKEDKLLHVAVYEWLISNNLGSELLSDGLVPSSLRTYLQEGARSAPAQVALTLLDLLWKVQEKCGDHLAAAHVLEELATRPGGGATLAQRMSWLSAGVECARGARRSGGGGGKLLRRLEEASEVARLQATVRAHCLARPTHLQPPPRALHALDDQLLDLSQLYEKYADRYNLYACKLAIMQCSGHDDELLVESIWSSLLAEAESAAFPLPLPAERLSAVLAKLAALGREFSYSVHYFPLYYIIRQLEIMSCKMQVPDQRMVFRAALNTGISIYQLLNVYIKLVSMNERVWLGCGDELHVSACAACLLETARGELPGLVPELRRRALARCKDLYDCTISVLQARPYTQRLIDRISKAQAHLDRMD